MRSVTGIERRGREEGRVAGQIQLIERLLGMPESPMSQLVSISMATLQLQLEKLQKDLAVRMV